MKNLSGRPVGLGRPLLDPLIKAYRAFYKADLAYQALRATFALEGDIPPPARVGKPSLPLSEKLRRATVQRETTLAAVRALEHERGVAPKSERQIHVEFAQHDYAKSVGKPKKTSVDALYREMRRRELMLERLKLAPPEPPVSYYQRGRRRHSLQEKINNLSKIIEDLRSRIAAERNQLSLSENLKIDRTQFLITRSNLLREIEVVLGLSAGRKENLPKIHAFLATNPGLRYAKALRDLDETIDLVEQQLGQAETLENISVVVGDATVNLSAEEARAAIADYARKKLSLHKDEV